MAASYSVGNVDKEGEAMPGVFVPEGIDEVLRSHKRWLSGRGGGERANLSGVDLSHIRFGDVTLKDANLAEANLDEAWLVGADLYRANLAGASMRCATLTNASLRGANLTNSDLSDADLRSADLTGANLSGALLSRTRLTNAICDNVIAAGMSLVYVKEAPESLRAWSSIVPETGSFEMWKRCRDGVIVRLLVPEDAKRTNAARRAVRVSKAIVLEVIGADEALSLYSNDVVYRVGETVEPEDEYEDDWTMSCASGIYGYLTRLEAEA
jgi:hypothetical protein